MAGAPQPRSRRLFPSRAGEHGAITSEGCWIRDCSAIVGHGKNVTVRAFHRVGRFFLLGVALLSTPGFGLAKAQRSHCATHGASPTHSMGLGNGHGAYHSSTSSLSRPSHSDCPHCPVTECAVVAPCSASGTSAASPTILTLRTPCTQHFGMARTSALLHSTTLQPPTPPPQTIA